MIYSDSQIQFRSQVIIWAQLLLILETEKKPQSDLCFEETMKHRDNIEPFTT